MRGLLATLADTTKEANTVEQFISQMQEAVEQNLGDEGIDSEPWRALESILACVVGIGRAVKEGEKEDIKADSVALAALAYFIYAGVDKL